MALHENDTKGISEHLHSGGFAAEENAEKNEAFLRKQSNIANAFDTAFKALRDHQFEKKHGEDAYIDEKLKEKKPILPSEKEIKINKPSRSAKLRYAFKISDDKNFEEEILKTFKYLIDIENFSVKL